MPRLFSASRFALLLTLLAPQTPAPVPTPPPLVPCTSAWILWGQLASLTWVPIDGYERWAACDAQRARSQQGNEKTLYACFPDTFSPRGR